MGANQAVDAVNWTLEKVVQLGLIENNSVSKYPFLESRLVIHSNEQSVSQETP